MGAIRRASSRWFVPVVAGAGHEPVMGRREIVSGRVTGRRLVAGVAATLTLALSFPGAASAAAGGAQGPAASGWAFQSVPVPAGDTYISLSGISCTSAASCLAAAPGLGAEYWDGSTWAPQESSTGGLSAVSCVSADSCELVGTTGASGGNNVTLAEYWNGSTFTRQHTLSPGGEGSLNYAILDAVSCSSAVDCLAVGWYQLPHSQNSNVRLLAEQWDGSTWKKLKTRAPVGNQGAAFYGLSCVTADDCIAVGYAATDTAVNTLAEHWNGQAWKIQATPSPGTAQNQFNAISCAAASHCKAVGYASDSFTSLSGTALAETWNGRTWSAQATPVPAKSVSSVLNGVSCVSPANCTAVGSSTTSPLTASTRTLAERWNGGTWAQQRTAHSTDGTELDAVYCAAGGFCIAGGEDITTDLPIAETRNG